MVHQINNVNHTFEPARAARIYAYVVGFLVVLVAGLYAIVSGVVPGKLVEGGDSLAATIYAHRVALRSLVVVGLLAVVLLRHNWSLIWLALLLNGIIQIGDGVQGVLQSSAADAIGPLVMGLLLLSAAWRVRPPSAGS